MRWLAKTVCERVSDSTYGAIKLDFLRTIKESGKNGVRGRDLARLRPFRDVKPAERVAILRDLEAGELIEHVSLKRAGTAGGRPSEVWIIKGYCQAEGRVVS